MKTYLARYTLHGGARGTLHVLAACSCDAVVAAIDAFGLSLRTCSVRAAVPSQASAPHFQQELS